jgi:hypothetical protein
VKGDLRIFAHGEAEFSRRAKQATAAAFEKFYFLSFNAYTA